MIMLMDQPNKASRFRRRPADSPPADMRTALEPLQQRDYQDRVVDKSVGFFKDGESSVLIESPTGCHRAGQGILMFDGSVRPVERVAVGDGVMGPDGAVRTVVGLCRGRGRMVEISPATGSPWVVNEDHVLTLARDARGKYEDLAERFRLMDVTVKDWLGWEPKRRRPYKLFRVGRGGTIRRVSFSVRQLDGAERYYGFSLTGDRRYLLDDSTVTHNSGKTVMGLRICQRLAEMYGWRTNWVAMRRNLLRQVADMNARYFGLEGLTPVSMFEKDPPQAEITVVDEAQHDAAASCVHIHARSGSKIILGLSATPHRTDKLKLAFRRVVRDAGIHRLITDGWLAPFEHWSVDNWDVPHVASVYLEEREKWGKSVAFFHRVEQCLEFAEILAGAGRHCEVITADTDRERQLDDFEADRFDVVANVAILNEGFDCPPLRTVFVRDASKLPTIQMAGRAFRQSPETGKTHCNVVQSGHARWQFTRTARPRQSHALRGGRWVTLGNSVRIDEVARETMGRVAAIEVNMPKYLSADAQKKRHGAARGRGRRRRFQREPNLVGD